MPDNNGYLMAPFVCTACGWTDDYRIPDDKPALDVLDSQCCSGCGQDGMTMTRLYGVEDLADGSKAAERRIIEWLRKSADDFAKDDYYATVARVLHNHADAIERGEHR